MKIHLVGGFLGSGKTTGIINACIILTNKGVVTSVITNDQGNYLVDSRFVQQMGIPNEEVTGGCFCCNYNQLDTQINSLVNNYNPSEIFAEFVGSCTDLIATVLKPLLEYKKSEIELVTFSSFVDVQLLLMHLQNKNLPFSTETNYIWEKQIEESEILIINKIDLLSTEELDNLHLFVKDLFPSKQLLFQNSLDLNSIGNWINILSKHQEKEHKVIDIDYVKYGAGEANLAWLDEEIEIITTDNSAIKLAFDFMNILSEDIVRKDLPIGHLKFYVSFEDKSLKLSYTTILDRTKQEPMDIGNSNSVHLLINARIQTTPDTLRNILFDNLNQLKSRDKVSVNELFLSYFQPGFPDPTHRLG